jgi:hypothetical protein
MWCVADLTDEYIDKMEDVLEIYERPYDPQEPVVCLDEKPVTLHADIRPPSPAVPGREARRDNEYERCGTANVFCAVEPKAGRHFTSPTGDRSAFEFARFACDLARTSEARSGAGLLSITHRSMEAGLIKRRSKSACSHDNVWAREEFRI